MDRMIYTGLTAINATADSRISQAQNLANLSVPGFRRDLENEAGPKFLDALGQATTRVFQSETKEHLFSEKPGMLDRTGQDLDFAIADAGYFFVQQGEGDPALSRRGDFHRAVDGTLKDGAGATLLDVNLAPVQVPPFQRIGVTDLGELEIVPLGGGPAQVVGVLATVVPEAGTALEKGADGMIRAADGTVPPPNQQAKVLQGVLERSNVNPIEEMLGSIELQRRFEIGMRTIMNARELDEAGSRLLRAPEA